MKVIPSALVAELRGSTAELTAASWKGINYVRRKVVPKNPKSAGQTLVRESMTACVTLWRSLHATVKSWLDTYGTNYSMSGFNVFTSKNRALEQASALLKPVPDNPQVDAVTAFAPVTGVGASGTIDVTWTDPVNADFTRIGILARLASGNLFEFMISPLTAAETFTIEGLVAGEDYDVYGFLYNITLGSYGTSTGTLAVAAKA